MKTIQRIKRKIRQALGSNPPMGSDLEPHPPDAELESLEILGGVRDLQKFCCELALKNCPGLDWAEFGVSRGIGAAHFLEHLPETNRLYLFDSWEGLPEDWENHKEGQYRAPVPDFKDGRAHLIKGLFGDTIPGWVKTQKEPLGFLHMDADLYSSTILALDYLNPLIVPGTIILFDEYYNYAGWRDHEHKAFMEFIDKHNRKFRYIGKNDKHAAFPERNDQKTSKFVRVAVEILV